MVAPCSCLHSWWLTVCLTLRWQYTHISIPESFSEQCVLESVLCFRLKFMKRIVCHFSQEHWFICWFARLRSWLHLSFLEEYPMEPALAQERSLLWQSWQLERCSGWLVLSVFLGKPENWRKNFWNKATTEVGFKGGDSLLWQEESKETGGFEAEDSKGDSVPFGTRLCGQSLVCYTFMKQQNTEMMSARLKHDPFPCFFCAKGWSRRGKSLSKEKVQAKWRMSRNLYRHGLRNRGISKCCPIHMEKAERPFHIDKQGNSE